MVGKVDAFLYQQHSTIYPSSFYEIFLRVYCRGATLIELEKKCPVYWGATTLNSQTGNFCVPASVSRTLISCPP